MKLFVGIISWCGVAALAMNAPVSAQKDKDLNVKVLEYVKRNLGKQVDDGECASLAVAALNSVGAKPFGTYKDSPNDGDYVWGELVYALEITPTLRTESIPIDTFVKPGDIIQYRNAKFAGKQGTGKYTSEAPHHTAVITGVSKDGKTFDIHQQNANGKKTVAPATVKINDLQSGWVKVYRPQKP